MGFTRTRPDDEVVIGDLESLAKQWSSCLGIHGDTGEDRVFVLRVGEPHTFIERFRRWGW